MVREDFSFDSRDNKTKLHAAIWIPDGEPKAVVQIVHGMAEHIGRYEDFAKFLAEKGFVVVGDDHLGHGKSVTDGKYGFFCSQDPATVVVRDVHRLKKLTQERFPGIPYFILGHSMGSFILRNYLFRYGKGIDGAIVMGTGMVPKPIVISLKLIASLGCFFGHAAKPSDMINGMSFGTYLKKIDNPRTPYDWLTKENSVVDTYIADPLSGFTFPCNGFLTLAELILRLYKKSNLEKMPVTLPVLFVSGKDDPVGDYGQAPMAVYKSFLDEGLSKTEIKLYENDRHEILNESDHDVVYNDLLTWIEDKISS